MKWGGDSGAEIGADAAGVSGFGGHLIVGTAKAPHPVFKPLRGFLQGSRVKIGPKHIGEIQLCVRGLSQQEIADAGLASGSDQQLRIGQVCGAQVRGQTAGV